jgi:hypothetical protein
VLQWLDASDDTEGEGIERKLSQKRLNSARRSASLAAVSRFWSFSSAFAQLFFCKLGGWPL